MIAKVIGIVEKPTAKGGKYLNVTLESNGKKVSVNSFVEADNATFLQAKESGASVDVTITKNDKGYDQFDKVLINGQPPVIPTPDAPQHENRPPQVTPPILIKLNQDEEKTRCVCLSYSKDLVTAGYIKINDILTYAEQFRDYVISGKLTIK